MAGNKCGECGKEMVTKKTRYKGLVLDVDQCPRCKSSYFSEKQFAEAFKKIQQARLKDSYLKTPIRIGNSIGITFPKEVVEAFQLKKKKVRMKPNIGTGVIAIEVA
jgi:hypothetical protein